MLTLTVLAAHAAAAHAAGSAIGVCAGETRDDYTCAHDPTHRICAQLVNQTTPALWGSIDFWKTTGQISWQKTITKAPNPGDSWCVCMFAVADLIHAVGCENVHVNCSATDLDYVYAAYSEGSGDLETAHKCMLDKCGNTKGGLDEKTLSKAKAVAAERQRAYKPAGSRKLTGKKGKQQAAIAPAPKGDDKGVGGSSSVCDACMSCVTSCFTDDPSECDAGPCTFDDSRFCWSLSPAEGFDACYGGEGETHCGTAPKHRSRYDCKAAASTA